jgi:hypothetical protein
MKLSSAFLSILAIAPLLLLAETVTNKVVTETTTTQSTSLDGVVRQVNVDTERIVVNNPDTNVEQTYSWNKTTRFISPTGSTVTYEALRPGERATFIYTPSGDQMVLNQVVVNGGSFTGVVNEINPSTGRLVVTTPNKEIAKIYSWTKAETPLYIDSTGRTIALESLRVGDPVTVYYSGDYTQPRLTRIVYGPELRPQGKLQSPVQLKGVINSINSGAANLIIQTANQTIPQTLSWTERTQFVDFKGRTISHQSIKPGEHVLIDYIKNGDQLTLSRVQIEQSK